MIVLIKYVDTYDKNDYIDNCYIHYLQEIMFIIIIVSAFQQSDFISLYISYQFIFYLHFIIFIFSVHNWTSKLNTRMYTTVIICMYKIDLCFKIKVFCIVHSGF